MAIDRVVNLGDLLYLLVNQPLTTLGDRQARLQPLAAERGGGLAVAVDEYVGQLDG